MQTNGKHDRFDPKGWMWVVLVSVFTLDIFMFKEILSFIPELRYGGRCGTWLVSLEGLMFFCGGILLLLTIVALQLYFYCKENLSPFLRAIARFPICYSVALLSTWFIAFPIVQEPDLVWIYAWLPVSMILVFGGLWLLRHKYPRSASKSFIKDIVRNVAAVGLTITFFLFLSTLKFNILWLRIHQGDSLSRVTDLLGPPNSTGMYCKGNNPSHWPAYYTWHRGLIAYSIIFDSEESGSESDPSNPIRVDEKGWSLIDF